MQRSARLKGSWNPARLKGSWNPRQRLNQRERRGKEERAKSQRKTHLEAGTRGGGASIFLLPSRRASSGSSCLGVTSISPLLSWRRPSSSKAARYTLLSPPLPSIPLFRSALPSSWPPPPSLLPATTQTPPPSLLLAVTWTPPPSWPPPRTYGREAGTPGCREKAGRERESGSPPTVGRREGGGGQEEGRAEQNGERATGVPCCLAGRRATGRGRRRDAETAAVSRAFSGLPSFPLLAFFLSRASLQFRVQLPLIPALIPLLRAHLPLLWRRLERIRRPSSP